MICERCWIVKTHGFGCRTSFFEEFPKLNRLNKLLKSAEEALNREDFDVLLCTLERLIEELKR